jgi:hypothetical protein
MYRFAKTLHLIALALFLGSIFAHIVASQLGGPPGTADFTFAREEISAATRALTLPGLMLAILSGLWMAFLSGISPLRQPWIAAHAGMAVGVALIAAILVVPAGRTMLSNPSLDEIGTALTMEHAAGGLNILLTLAIVAVGVWKRRWRKGGRPAE